jgi:RNA polymerase sigma-70 factor (ECF subfamily)
LINDEFFAAIERLTDELSPKQKAVFVLRDMEQMTMSEVAEVLSMDARQLKSNLYYARKKVSEMVTLYYETKKAKP